MQFQSLCQEDPLEEGMASHSSIFAWRIPIDRGAWWARVHGVEKLDKTEWLSTHSYFLDLYNLAFHFKTNLIWYDLPFPSALLLAQMVKNLFAT